MASQRMKEATGSCAPDQVTQAAPAASAAQVTPAASAALAVSDPLSAHTVSAALEPRESPASAAFVSSASPATPLASSLSAAPAPAPLLPVAERFVSVNGEGTHAGRLAAFVRFVGCNLRCSYCDTRWACEPGCPCEHMSVADVVRFVRESEVRCCTLTGGEPLLQPGVPALLRELLATVPHLYVEIETNGAVDLSPFTQLRAEVGGTLSFTMDWKLPSSGMEQHMCAHNLALVDSRDTVKFVVGTDGDLREALRVVRAHHLCDRTSVYLSPVFGQMEPARIVEFMQENKLTNATVQVQLHKIIWPNVEKGV